MLGYVLRRLAWMGPLVLGISLVTFIILHLAPGNPADMVTEGNPRITAEAKARIRALYGLDDPWYVQYGRWLSRMARLDFGNSFLDDRPVIDKITERLPNTLLLNVLSLGLIFVVALPLGVLAAVKRGSWFDRASTVFVYVGFSIPTFWLALLLMLVLGVKLGWLPVSGMTSLEAAGWPWPKRALDLLQHLVLPVGVSAFAGLAGISRYARTSVLEVIRQDYIRTARAKGLPEGTVIWKHALRNALIPIVTLLGLSLPDLIGGGFIFETIFAWPGMGRLGFEAYMARDYTVIMGVGVIAALLTLVGNFLADVTYALVDPRIRYR